MSGGSSLDGKEQYVLAVCPGCGVRLTGSREPGDEDYCQWAERNVILKPANENHRSCRPMNSDAPGPFGPDWIATRLAIKSHRNGDRVPVHITSIDPRNNRALNTDTLR